MGSEVVDAVELEVLVRGRSTESVFARDISLEAREGDLLRDRKTGLGDAARRSLLANPLMIWVS